MKLTHDQILGWKANNGAMSPNEFMALCDLAMIGLSSAQSESERTFAPPPAMVRAALLVLLGHVDPGWDNCKWVVQAWLDGKLDPNTPPAEAPPGYRTGKRRLIYNKLTKQIDVVTTEGFVVDSFDPPQEVG